MKQLALDLAPPAPPTLENFVVGRNTELVQNLRLLATASARERFVYLWGLPGCGRSHLLMGVVALMRSAGSTAVYLPGAPGMRLPEGAREVDCVGLDDVERLDPETQLAAFHVYNALRERHGTLVAAGAAPPVQLKLRADLVTRLAWGLVYQVSALTDGDKGRALDRHAAARGFRLPPEVRDFLLTRGRRDMPSLLGMVDALDRYSLETKRAVTVPLVREMLAESRARGPGSGIRDAGPGSAG
jgi:DnaA family protein